MLVGLRRSLASLGSRAGFAIRFSTMRPILQHCSGITLYGQRATGSAWNPEDGTDRRDGTNDSPSQAHGRGEIGTGDKVVAGVSADAEAHAASG